MKTASTITRFLTQKPNIIRIKELKPAIDLINQAAILVDLDEETVILANKAAYDLWGEEQSWLDGQIISDLFPPEPGKGNFLEMERANLSEPFNLVINTRYGKLVIIATPAFIGTDMRWLLIKLEPVEELRNRKDKNQQIIRDWEYIQKLIESLQETDHSIAMSQACQASRELLGCDAIAIYQLNASRPILDKFHTEGEASWLPEELTASEIMQNHDFSIWRKGKRPGTALQQTARSQGLGMVISFPLGQKGAWSGLGIIASYATEFDGLEQQLSLVQVFLSTTHQLHILLENQHDALDKMLRGEKAANFIQDTIKDSLIVVDNEFCIQHMNKSAVDVLGYILSEVLNQPVTSILIGEKKLDWLLENIKQGVDFPQGEQTRLYRRSGNSFLANLRIMRLIEEHQPAEFLILIQDLSELEEFRQRNEQLKQQALLGEVTASFAHETKNPINSLSTGIQLLQASLPKDDPLQENVRRLQQSCDRLNSIITSGLSFIRPMEYKMQPIRVEKLIQRLLNTTWQQRLHKHQVKAEFHTNPKIPMIEGDERALEHLFTNLFDNAIDAMSTNSPEVPRVLGISIQSAPAPNRQTLVEVRMSDTGPGISEGIREKIFEPFYTTKSNGTGVGLAIVKRITTAHRGMVKVDSFTGGTIFSLQIPATNMREVLIEEVNR